MKKLAVLVTLVWCGAIAAVVAQRSFTNPNRDSYLKTLFPKAVAFSPLAGDPPHIKAFGVDTHRDPGAAPIGVAWWTTDLDPQDVAPRWRVSSTCVSGATENLQHRPAGPD